MFVHMKTNKETWNHIHVGIDAVVKQEDIQHGAPEDYHRPL